MSDTGADTGKLYLGALAVPDRLEGSRIVIRPFEPSDLRAFQEAVEESREHLRPWMPWAEGHRTPEESLDFIARTKAQWIMREQVGGGLFLKEDGRLLGGIGLHPRDWKARIFEIGYWLRPSATGHGYVREGVMVLSRLAFDVLGANRVLIRCDAHNERSRRVAEACGYTFEGHHRRDAITPAGTLRDTLYFSLLREEYEARLPDWRPLLGDTAQHAPFAGE